MWGMEKMFFSFCRKELNPRSLQDNLKINIIFLIIHQGCEGFIFGCGGSDYKVFPVKH